VPDTPPTDTTPPVLDRRSLIVYVSATALLVVFYQVPIGNWQRAIMLGLAPYLLVFVTALSMLRRHGWAVRDGASLLDALAYLGVVLFWAWAAWRKDAPRLAEGREGSPA